MSRLRIMNWSFWKQAGWVSRSTVLRKMSIGRHRYVEIKDGGLVYIVTTPSIAKEAVVARVENMIYQAGGIVKLITSSLRACLVTETHGTCSWWSPFFVLNTSSRSKGIPRIGCPCAGSDGSRYLAWEYLYSKTRNCDGVRKGDFRPCRGGVSAGDVMIDGNAIGDVGNIVLRDRLVRRRDLYRGDHGESQREENYFQSACTPVVLSMLRRVGIFFVKVANWSTKALKIILNQDSFDWGWVKRFGTRQLV